MVIGNPVVLSNPTSILFTDLLGNLDDSIYLTYDVSGSMFTLSSPVYTFSLIKSNGLLGIVDLGDAYHSANNTYIKIDDNAHQITINASSGVNVLNGVIAIGTDFLIQNTGLGNVQLIDILGSGLNFNGDGSVNLFGSSTDGIQITASGDLNAQQNLNVAINASINGFITDLTSRNSIDSNNRINFYADGITQSINWQSSKLFNVIGQITADWQNQFLIDPTSTVATINWATETMTDLSNVESLNWNIRYLYDSTATPSLNWAGRFTYDSSAIASIDWENRFLITSFGTTVDWANLFLYDSSSSLVVDWGVQALYPSGSSSPSLNWTLGQLFQPSTGSLTLDWQAEQLIEAGSGIAVVDWSLQLIRDIVSNSSVDWGQRALYWIDGTTKAVDYQNLHLNNTGGNMADWSGGSFIHPVPVTANGTAIYSNAAFSWYDGHLDNEQQLPPTISTAVIGATVVLGSKSTDSAGIATFTPGGGGVLPGTLFTVLYNKKYNGQSIVNLTPASSGAGATALGWYLVSSSSTGFSVGATGTVAGIAPKTFHYHVIGIN